MVLDTAVAKALNCYCSLDFSCSIHIWSLHKLLLFPFFFWLNGKWEKTKVLRYFHAHIFAPAFSVALLTVQLIFFWFDFCFFGFAFSSIDRLMKSVSWLAGWLVGRWNEVLFTRLIFFRHFCFWLWFRFLKLLCFRAITARIKGYPHFQFIFLLTRIFYFWSQLFFKNY